MLCITQDTVKIAAAADVISELRECYASRRRNKDDIAAAAAVYRELREC